MSSVENYKEIRSKLPESVTLVAVSKTYPVQSIQELYTVGCRDFGENKVQELEQKQLLLPKNINWHFIGHLQTNKVKQIAPFIHLIHSVDSLKLLQEINKEAKKNKRIINCLLQFYIATEETKYGFSMEEVTDMLTSKTYSELTNVSLCGIMGMASFSSDTSLIKNEFSVLRQYFEQLQTTFFSQSSQFNIISMGMSSDYSIAIEEGSTLVRLGTIIFGAREYLR